MQNNKFVKSQSIVFHKAGCDFIFIIKREYLIPLSHKIYLENLITLDERNAKKRDNLLHKISNIRYISKLSAS